MLTRTVLPRVSSRISHMYLEHCRVSVQDFGIAVLEANGTESVIPVATIAALLLGPGVTISSKAVQICSQHDVTIAWVGEDGIRAYSFLTSAEQSTRRLVHQVARWSDPVAKADVARAMFRMRFGDRAEIRAADVAQLLGMEGALARKRYAELAREHAIPWDGRSTTGAWTDGSPLNRALSAGNACVNAAARVAVTTLGYSPAFGFLHTGKQISFALDIADLYKMEVSAPAAFAVIAEHEHNVETRTRHKVRDLIHERGTLHAMMGATDTLLGWGP